MHIIRRQMYATYVLHDKSIRPTNKIENIKIIRREKVHACYIYMYELPEMFDLFLL